MKNKKSLFLLVSLITSIILSGCANVSSQNAIQTQESISYKTPLANASIETTKENLVNESYNFFVEFIDVGQGDSMLIGCDNEYMLVDGGEYEYANEVKEELDERNITTLKYLVGTHPHSDHIGSLDVIINDYEIETLFLPNATSNTKTFEYLLDAIEENSLEITIPNSGEVYELGDAIITFLGPNEDDTFDDLNDYSLGIRIDYGETSFLMCGDATSTEKMFMEYDVDVDVFKASHHGSKYTNSQAFLNAVSPKYIVVSCGEENSYGHPHQDFLNRIDNDIMLYQTNENGDIIFYSNGVDYLVELEKGEIKTQSSIMESIKENNAQEVLQEKDTIVYITSSGTKYHTWECKYTNEKSTPITIEDALQKGLSPCKVCNP